MKDKEFMANLNDTESDFEFVEKVKDELEKRGLAAEYKNFVEEIGKEQNPENFGAIAEKYLTKGKEEPKSLDAIKDNFTPPTYKGHLEEDNPPNTTITLEDEERFGKDALKGLTGPRESEQLKEEIDTNDNGEIEVDEMADFQKSLDDYAAKNKKGRDDIPVTTRR